MHTRLFMRPNDDTYCLNRLFWLLSYCDDFKRSSQHTQMSKLYLRLSWLLRRTHYTISSFSYELCSLFGQLPGIKAWMASKLDNSFLKYPVCWRFVTTFQLFWDFSRFSRAPIVSVLAIRSKVVSSQFRFRGESHTLNCVPFEWSRVALIDSTVRFRRMMFHCISPAITPLSDQLFLHESLNEANSIRILI